MYYYVSPDCTLFYFAYLVSSHSCWSFTFGEFYIFILKRVESFMNTLRNTNEMKYMEPQLWTQFMFFYYGNFHYSGFLLLCACLRRPLHLYLDLHGGYRCVAFCRSRHFLDFHKSKKESAHSKQNNERHTLQRPGLLSINVYTLAFQPK